MPSVDRASPFVNGKQAIHHDEASARTPLSFASVPVPPSFWYPEGTMTTAKPQYSKAMKTALKTLEEISHITITQEEIDSLTNEESDRLLAALMNAQDAIGSKFNSLRHM